MNRLIRFCICQCLLLAACIAAPVRASEPTTEQLEAFSRLFGFDRLIANAVEMTMPDLMEALGMMVADGKQLDGGTLPAHVRERLQICTRHQKETIYIDAVHASLRERLKTGENIEGWKQFAATEPGSRFIGQVRRIMISTGDPDTIQESTPSYGVWLESLPVQWQDQIKAFVASPAGRSYLDSDFDIPFPDPKDIVQQLVAVCVSDSREHLPDAAMPESSSGQSDTH